MKPKGPVLVLDLFPEERRELLALLSGLPAEAWEAATVCAGWSVKDLAAHILADDLGNLARGRDGHGSSSFTAPPSWDELVIFINEQNEDWVRTMRRLSPRLLVELLGFSGERLVAYFRGLDPMAPGFSVSWAGPGPHAWWLHVAREYTERWMHQEQVREAVGAPGLRGRRLFHPVLDTFVHALPHTYRDMPAPEGTHVRLTVTGDAGGAWSLVRHGGRWDLYDEMEAAPASTVTLDEDTAWRLFTKGIDRDTARARMTCEGDQELGQMVLSTLAIIA